MAIDVGFDPKWSRILKWILVVLSISILFYTCYDEHQDEMKKLNAKKASRVVTDDGQYVDCWRVTVEGKAYFKCESSGKYYILVPMKTD